MRRCPPRPPKVGRPGITQLPMPDDRFDLRNTPGFEAEQSVIHEDHYRAERLRRQAAKAERRHARMLLALADAIDPSITAYPTTPASSRYMRTERIRIIGAVWAMMHDAAPTSLATAQYATFTAIPGNSSVPRGELDRFDPKRYIASIRQHLIRSAAKLGVAVEGQLFAALHGAYDPTTQSYPMHVHGVAIGGMIDIVDGLRDLRKYCPAQPYDDRDAANTPVRLSRGPLTNMPAPATYTLKGFWGLRTTYVDSDGLRKAYAGPVRRIRGEAEIEYLQFLDRWRLEDVTLLMGMRATRSGLLRT